MIRERKAFTGHAMLLFDYAFPVFERSNKYRCDKIQFHQLLEIGDRLVACTEGNRDFGVLPESYAELLREASEKAKVGALSSYFVSKLLVEVEGWLKWVLQVAKPDLYEQRLKADWREIENRFTLHNVIGDLEVLSGDQLKLSSGQRHRIKDPVEHAVHHIKHARNEAVHGAARTEQAQTIQTFTDAMVTVLAPLAKNRVTILDKLRGLILNPFQADQHGDVRRESILVERESHLKKFHGRARDLEALCGYLDSNNSEGRYLLVVGQQGMGKSALVAQVSREMNAGISPIGPGVGLVTSEAPWLPATIFIHGKSACTPYGAVQEVVTQANTLLREQLPPLVLEQPNPERRDLIEGFRDPDERTERSNVDKMQQSLHMALFTLAKERGEAILILDALDELVANAEDLDFLPKHLPRNTRCILTCRDRVDLRAWLSEKRPTDLYCLEKIERRDVPGLTGVDDASGESAQQFNDKVHAATSGWPLALTETGRRVAGAGGSFQKIQIEESMNGIFKTWAQNWTRDQEKESHAVLEMALAVLAALEPVGPIKVKDLFEIIGEPQEITLGELRAHLDRTSEQFFVVDATAYRLANPPYGRYLRDEHLSRHVSRGGAISAGTWIFCKEDHDELISKFSSFYAKSNSIEAGQLSGVTEEIIDRLGEMSDRATLYRVGMLSLKFCIDVAEHAGVVLAMRCNYFEVIRLIGLFRGYTQGDFPGAERCLRVGVETGDLDCVKVLILILAAGDKGDEAKSLFEEYFSINSGPMEAEMLLCGIILFSDLGEDLKRFEAPCDNLIQEHQAKLVGKMEAEGQNDVEGLLRNKVTMAILSSVYYLAVESFHHSGTGGKFLDYLRIFSVANEGAVKLFADFVNTRAVPESDLVFLAERIGTADRDTRKSFLKHLNSETLSWLFLYWEAETRIEVESLVREQAANDSEWMRKYLSLFILGVIAENYDGEELGLFRGIYQENANVGWSLYVDKLMADPDRTDRLMEAKDVLENMALQKNVEAMWVLGTFLLEGWPCRNDTSRGIDLLREAAQNGEAEAKRSLASYLSKHRLVEADLDEAEELWGELASDGDVQASVRAGTIVAGQDGFSLLGADELKRGCANGDRWATWELIHILLDPQSEHYDYDEGLKWTQFAARVYPSGNYENYVQFKFFQDPNGVSPSEERYHMERLSRCRHPEGMLLFAEMLLVLFKADGIPKQNVSLAREVSKMAMKKVGCPKSRFLNLLFFSGSREDRRNALLELRTLAENADPENRFFLGNCLLFDHSEPGEHGEGARILDGLLSAGKRWGPLAREEMSSHHLYCPCEYADPGQGLRLLLSQNQDNPDLLAMAGKALLDGVRVKGDPETGVELLEKAIRYESKAARAHLGDHLLKGTRIARETNRGLALLNRAIIQRCPDAHVILGDHYLRGKTLEVDRDRGLELLWLATRNRVGWGALLLKEHLTSLGMKSELKKLDEWLDMIKPTSRDEIYVEVHRATFPGAQGASSGSSSVGLT